MIKKRQKSMQKTSVYNTVQGRHISHTFITAKIIVFDPMMCNSPDVPLRDKLLTRTSQLRTG